MAQTSSTLHQDLQPTELQLKLARRKGLAGAVVGNIIENYDFSVYGYLSALLAIVFFQEGDPSTAMLATLATFASAFLLRPIGGLLFGHLGDRLGRRAVLITTVVLMSGATMLIGLLPTYAAIGVGSTALLVLARIAQGLAAGGELAGAGSFLREIAPPGRVGFYVSFTQFGAFIGAILASLVALGLNSLLSQEQLLGWGWRLPFLIAIPLGITGLLIRLRLEDSQEFVESKKSSGVAKTPIFEVLSHWKRPVFQACGICILTLGGFYIIYVYLALHISSALGMPSQFAFWSTTATLVVSCLSMPLFGHLADKIGAKRVILFGSTGILLLAYPLFTLLAVGGTVTVMAHICLGILIASLTAVGFTVFTGIFPVRVRFTGVALSVNVSAVAVGGTAPLIATYLVQTTGSAQSPALFLMACALVTLSTAMTLKNRQSVQ